MKDTHSRPKKRRFVWRMVSAVLIGLVIVIIGLTIEAWPALGGRVEGERLARAERSPQYRDGAFQNVLPNAGQISLPTAAWRFYTDETPYKEPEVPLATVPRTTQDFATLRDSLRVTWLGHSTLLVELDSARVLIDPVWGERVSPSRFIGSRRFAPQPLALPDVPSLDAVLISHDHYDHLDMPTVQQLGSRVMRWVVPLGVGAHLEHWGIAPEAIVELDWWETTRIGRLELVSTPARHFSGRALNDAAATLWTGWAILGQNQRVFYSGDTALTPSFAEVGQRTDHSI